MKTNLSKAKEALVAGPTLAINKSFGDALAAAVENGEWIAAPVIPDEHGNRLVIQTNKGRPYVVLFTGEDHYHSEKGMSLMMSDINKIIDSIYSSPHLEGFVLDPYTSPIYISRAQLNDTTSRMDPRLERRNWGKGIPKYLPEDLMTEVEVQKFAMQVSESFGLHHEGYQILESTLNPMDPFSYAARKDGQLYFILVESSVAPRKPSLSQIKKQRLLASARKHNAKAIYIPVGIGACDAERFSAGLALIGDAYYADYHGMYKVDEDGTVKLMDDEEA